MFNYVLFVSKFQLLTTIWSRQQSTFWVNNRKHMTKKHVPPCRISCFNCPTATKLETIKAVLSLRHTHMVIDKIFFIIDKMNFYTIGQNITQFVFSPSPLLQDTGPHFMFLGPDCLNSGYATEQNG